jgi:hypothetical protein
LLDPLTEDAVRCSRGEAAGSSGKMIGVIDESDQRRSI